MADSTPLPTTITTITAGMQSLLAATQTALSDVADAVSDASAGLEGAQYPDTAIIYAATVDSEGEPTGAYSVVDTTPFRVEEPKGTPSTVVQAGRMVDRMVFTGAAPVSAADLITPESEIEVGGYRYNVLDTSAGATDAVELKVWMVRLR